MFVCRVSLHKYVCGRMETLCLGGSKVLCPSICLHVLPRVLGEERCRVCVMQSCRA